MRFGFGRAVSRLFGRFFGRLVCRQCRRMFRLSCLLAGGGRSSFLGQALRLLERCLLRLLRLLLSVLLRQHQRGRLGLAPACRHALVAPRGQHGRHHQHGQHQRAGHPHPESFVHASGDLAAALSLAVRCTSGRSLSRCAAATHCKPSWIVRFAATGPFTAAHLSRWCSTHQARSGARPARSCSRRWLRAESAGPALLPHPRRRQVFATARWPRCAGR